MKISGFSFARNADSLYYPVKESILSILPVCDEFIMVIGKGAPDDKTREIVSSISSPKIKIVDTVWTDKKDLSSDHVFRQQANLALAQCTGDWCFHLQCDEVVHETALPLIRKRCLDLMDDPGVEGMLLWWLHFWGDYEHYIINHHWFRREVRIIRNNIGIESWGDSQSFRRQGKKIKVVQLDATVFHYGYVRPPQVMRNKQAAFRAASKGRAAAALMQDAGKPYDYGSLEKVPRYNGSHPAVMSGRIQAMNWKDALQYSGKSNTRYHHDKLKYRILTFIEQKLLGGRQIGGYRNYIVIKR